VAALDAGLSSAGTIALPVRIAVVGPIVDRSDEQADGLERILELVAHGQQKPQPLSAGNLTRAKTAPDKEPRKILAEI
jgi:hypothetical protein